MLELIWKSSLFPQMPSLQTHPLLLYALELNGNFDAG